MKIIVKPGLDGLVSNAGHITGTPLPEGSVLVDLPGGTTKLPDMMAGVLRDGEIIIVPNWKGSGPWFVQAAPAPADGRQTIQKIKLSEIEVATVDRLTAIDIDMLDFDPEAKGWKMEPRAETAAEKKAREKAEADAKAAAEKAAIMSIEVDSRQLAEAAAVAGLISWADATAWAARGELIPALETAIDAAIPAERRDQVKFRAASALSYRRDDADLAAIFLALPGMTAEALDNLFVLAKGR